MAEDTTVVEVADVDDEEVEEVNAGQEPASTPSTAGQEPVVTVQDAPLLDDDVVATPAAPAWDLGRQRKDEELAKLRREVAERDAKLAELSAAHPSSEFANAFANLSELDEFADESAVKVRLNEMTKLVKQAVDVIGELRNQQSADRQVRTVDQIQAQLKVVVLEAAKSVNAKNPQEALPEVSERLKAKLKSLGFSTSNPPTEARAREIAENVALSVKVDRLANPKGRAVAEEVVPPKGSGGDETEPEPGKMSFVENVAAMRKARAAQRKR
jgi:hypothetical protein